MSRMTDFCDLCCDECGNWVDTACVTLKDARKVMGKNGWTHKGAEDWCPVCTEKRKVWKAMTK
jgi:hypothetical protein